MIVELQVSILVKKISHLTTLCFKFTNDEKNNDFFFFFISRKEDKMPESTIPAARSSEPYPGYSVLEGQYELHETGKYMSSKTLNLQWWPKFQSFSKKAWQASPLKICHYLTDHQHSKRLRSGLCSEIHTNSLYHQRLQTYSWQNLNDKFFCLSKTLLMVLNFNLWQVNNVSTSLERSDLWLF